MTDREVLEQQALETVCSCQFYELADCIEVLSDEELEALIEAPPQCTHHDYNV